MNGGRTEVVSLLNGIRLGLDEKQRLEAIEIGVCPPFVYLDQTEKLLAGSSLKIAAQDLSPELDGPFTGDISGSMLRDFSCTFVLVGHSERRLLHGENDLLVAAKAKMAQKVGLQPVVCIGESLEQKKKGETEDLISCQLQALRGLEGDKLAIAYEPIWAIGTGQSAPPGQVQDIHAQIRGQLPGLVTNADAVRIIYGGSLQPEGARDLFSMPDVDGGLVGGASLNAQDFLLICGAAV